MAIIHWVILSAFLLIFQDFYPSLIFNQQLRIDGEMIIRIFASFTYYGDFSAFWILLGCNGGLTVIIGFISYRISHDVDRSYYLTLILIFGIIIVLFFVLISPRTMESSNPRVSVPAQYWLWNFAHLAILGLISLVFSLVKHYFMKKPVPEQLKTIIRYECPHCHHLYEANVQYCQFCDRKIETIFHSSEATSEEI